jgi:DNA polymerase-3 subunit delta'
MQFSLLRGVDRPKEIVQRAVDSGKLSHALLLLGPEGNGKLAFAAALAAYLNCKSPVDGDSCGKCPDCIKATKLIHPDIHFILPYPGALTDKDKSPTAEVIHEFRPRFLDNPWLELEDWKQTLAADNKQLGITVDEIRLLKKRMSLKAFEGRFKVVIIWGADKMNISAANSFLKLLEEPPDNTILILTTIDAADLLPTIRSRCQTLLMNRIPATEIASYLEQKYNLEEQQALQVALMAEGNMRKAQVLAEKDTQSVSEKFPIWMRLCYEAKMDEISKLAEDFSRESREFQKFFMESALHRVRDTLKVRFLPENQLLFPGAEIQFLRKFNQTLTEAKLEKIASLIDEAVYHVSRNANAQMLMVSLSLKIHKILREKVTRHPILQ